VIGPLVLDAAGLDALSEDKPPALARSWMALAYERDLDVLVPAVVCAEVCRGRSRTRAVESFLTRHTTTDRGRARVSIVDTTFDVARQVGGLLAAAGADTSLLVDAHVVAACIPHGGGIVITSGPDDILRLAAAAPGLRVLTRPAR
jgi:predicted nucleic acid-binding protein